MHWLWRATLAAGAEAVCWVASMTALRGPFRVLGEQVAALLTWFGLYGNSARELLGLAPISPAVAVTLGVFAALPSGSAPAGHGLGLLPRRRVHEPAAPPWSAVPVRVPWMPAWLRLVVCLALFPLVLYSALGLFDALLVRLFDSPPVDSPFLWIAWLAIVLIAYASCRLVHVLLGSRWARAWRCACPACGYNLFGNVSGVCPECGRPAAGDAVGDDERTAGTRLKG